MGRIDIGCIAGKRRRRGVVHHLRIVRIGDVHGSERIADDEVRDGLLHGDLPA
ncbi:hypothetical protein [Bradyrhizobium sp. 139]|uniref:hypothetical protein n=1 Tax=Bradyrhizobium sp. 139 TaxID=2782616 RepID=UPI001FFA94C8|nr:hypothetical protein [Bradyrhizobium sp. 139]